MRCLLQVFANQKDKSQHLYEHFILRDGDHLTGLRPAPSSGKPGDRGRSPRLVSRLRKPSSGRTVGALCERAFLVESTNHARSQTAPTVKKRPTIDFFRSCYQGSHELTHGENRCSV